jgi:hypothetical protein
MLFKLRIDIFFEPGDFPVETNQENDQHDEDGKDYGNNHIDLSVASHHVRHLYIFFFLGKSQAT